jgi:Uma2 family endonuclease
MREHMPTHSVPRIPRYLNFPDIDRPYIELIAGRREPKMSPKMLHGSLQTRLGTWLSSWAGDRGYVGSECRYYFIPPKESGSRPSSLLPDVSYISRERLPPDLPKDEWQRPRIAPDIALEIISPGDREKSLAEKIRLYLAYGSRVVILVDPKKRTIAFHHADEQSAFPAQGKLAVPGYPDLILDADALFYDPPDIG